MFNLVKEIWLRRRELLGYIGDFQARWVLTVFYFSLMLPFGLIATLGMDLLRVRKAPNQTNWIKTSIDRQIDFDNARLPF